MRRENYALIVLSIGFWVLYVGMAPAEAAEKAKKPACPGPGLALAINKMIGGGIGDLKEKSERVIRTEEEWKTFWSKAKLPGAWTIDFKKDMVIAVSSGPGRGVVEMEIIGVELRKACLHVTVVERIIPPKYMELAQALHPFHIVRVSSAPGPVVFEYTQTTNALEQIEKTRK